MSVMHQLPPPAIPSTRVELSISAKELKDKDVLSKSDPLCVVLIKEYGSNRFFELGRTELVKNCLDPQWTKKFELDYRFEERQILRFHVYDWDTKSTSVHEQDSLGEMECSLAEIMASVGSSFNKALSKKGWLCVRGEELSTSKEIATLHFSGKDLDKKDFFGKSDPFLVISRCTENNQFVPVHKTEVIKNDLNPTWRHMKIPVRSLCKGDYDCSIKIECFDWDSDGSHDLIGECLTNLRAMKERSSSSYSLINMKKKAKKSSYKDSGKLILNSCAMHTEYTFLDHIQSGLQMHFTVAVDFTASNGDPKRPDSLHYQRPDVDNQYSLAIKSVGEIIQDYDSDKMFPALGFGARIPPDYVVSHEFFLNGSNDNPYCQGVEGILQAYKHSLQTVGLYGPTNFSPVIRHVTQFAKAHQDGKNYFVLLIITDGLITDLNDTKKALIEASQFPMSVIIVGVGDEDFSTMELLDGDNKRLTFGGFYAQRDIVQFVELKRHLYHRGQMTSPSCHKASLANDVLAEVPLQVVNWMNSRNFRPSIPQM